MRVLLVLLFLTSSAFSKPLVVATFSILGDMVHQVAGDKVDVKVLVGPNEDSHVYEPRPQDAKYLSHADLIVVNGLGFEGWLDRLIDASGSKARIVTATTGITPLEKEVNGKKTVDPHTWHSLKNAQIYIDNIVEGLSELLPEDSSYFKANGDAYKKSFQDLEIKTHEALKDIPLNDRKIITGHDAFGYLGAEFNIQFYAPQGMSTESEPSAKAVAELINLIKNENVKAIFVENISNPRLVEQIANESGVQIGGILYSDALSPPGTEADPYFKMMEHNLNAIVKSLGKE
jgi:zinc/manganese transport system substrate-binding protein